MTESRTLKLQIANRIKKLDPQLWNIVKTQIKEKNKGELKGRIEK